MKAKNPKKSVTQNDAVDVPKTWSDAFGISEEEATAVVGAMVRADAHYDDENAVLERLELLNAGRLAFAAFTFGRLVERRVLAQKSAKIAEAMVNELKESGSPEEFVRRMLELARRPR
jgi:hypothetical protein